MTQLKVFKIWKHTGEGKHSLSDPRFEIDAIMKCNGMSPQTKRETGAAIQKNIANKAVRANAVGHYPNMPCAAVIILTDHVTVTSTG